MPTRKFFFLVIFLIASLGVLSGHAVGEKTIEYIFKPLLMPALMGYFYFTIKPHIRRFAVWVLNALFFSWLGDVFLMFDHVSALFFILGLGSFLLAHVFYCVAYHFSVRELPRPLLLQKMPWLGLPYAAIGAGLYLYLFPHLGEMNIPVIFYATTIVVMNLFAINRYGVQPGRSFRLILLGAAVFMLSDACIAVDKFVSPLPYRGIVVMSTYLAAQFLIVRGAILQICKPRI